MKTVETGPKTKISSLYQASERQILEAAHEVTFFQAGFDVPEYLRKFTQRANFESRKVSKRALKATEGLVELNPSMLHGKSEEEKGLYIRNLSVFVDSTLRSEAASRRRLAAAGLAPIRLEERIAIEKQELLDSKANHYENRGRVRWGIPAIIRAGAAASLLLLFATGYAGSGSRANAEGGTNASAAVQVQTAEIKADASAAAKAGVVSDQPKTDVRTIVVADDGTVTERRVVIDGDRTRIEERSKLENANGKAEARSKTEARGVGADEEAKVKAESRVKNNNADEEARTRKEAEAKGNQAAADVQTEALINDTEVSGVMSGDASAIGEGEAKIKGRIVLKVGDQKDRIDHRDEDKGLNPNVTENERLAIPKVPPQDEKQVPPPADEQQPPAPVPAITPVPDQQPPAEITTPPAEEKEAPPAPAPSPAPDQTPVTVVQVPPVLPPAQEAAEPAVVARVSVPTPEIDSPAAVVAAPKAPAAPPAAAPDLPATLPKTGGLPGSLTGILAALGTGLSGVGFALRRWGRRP